MGSLVSRFLNTKEKVIFIMGSTGSGKTKLSVDLATHFNGEIINSDKIQVYKGLDILTNKATDSERHGIRHHLLGFIKDPDADYTVHEFCNDVQTAISEVTASKCIPIIAGGSNSYIEALVEDPAIGFCNKYDCCFIWLDVSLPVLFSHVGKRVDQMVNAGMLDEVERMYVPETDYGRGIRRSIGVPELDPYFTAKWNNNVVDEAEVKSLLKDGIRKTKENTCKLAKRQTLKIRGLKNKWNIQRIDVTCVYEKLGKDAQIAWETSILKPSLSIVSNFLKNNY